MNVAEDTIKLKNHVDGMIKTIEAGDYAYVKDGYHGDDKGGPYDVLFQRHCNKIVAKLVSLGYEYTTNHGFGCRDFSFSKPIEL
jgi:hypothetical protein